MTRIVRVIIVSFMLLYAAGFWRFLCDHKCVCVCVVFVEYVVELVHAYDDDPESPFMGQCLLFTQTTSTFDPTINDSCHKEV